VHAFRANRDAATEIVCVTRVTSSAAHRWRVYRRGLGHRLPSCIDAADSAIVVDPQSSFFAAFFRALDVRSGRYGTCRESRQPSHEEMTMRTPILFASLVTLALVAGCGAQGNDNSEGADPAASEGALETRGGQLDDNALTGKLGGILRGVSFTSESDYEYQVLVGDHVDGARLTTKLVREGLRSIVKEKSSSNRDILPASCRASRIDISKTISEGDSAEVPTDHNDDNYVYAHHDKQLGIALKVMRSQLKSVVGFTFGTNESGDEDDVGPVVYVYVGISKTSGKLIALMTEAVYT
jgi:hypothetical protein